MYQAIFPSLVDKTVDNRLLIMPHRSRDPGSPSEKRKMHELRRKRPMQAHAAKRTSHVACLRLGNPSTLQAAAKIYTCNDGSGFAVLFEMLAETSDDAGMRSLLAAL